MQADQEMLFEISLAANYMDIKALLGVGYKTIVNIIKGKPPEESTQGRKVGQTRHDNDADSRKTTTGIEEWHEWNRPINVYDFQNPLLDAGCKTIPLPPPDAIMAALQAAAENTRPEGAFPNYDADDVQVNGAGNIPLPPDAILAAIQEAMAGRCSRGYAGCPAAVAIAQAVRNPPGRAGL